MEPPPLAYPQPSLPQPVAPTAARNLRDVLLLLGPLVAATVMGFFLHGELGHFFLASWEVTPFAVLCVLGYIGLDRPAARVCAWIILGALLAGLVLVNLLLTLVALEGLPAKGNIHGAVSPHTAVRLLQVAGFSVVIALAAVLARVPACRRLCDVPAGSNEWTSVHTLALATVLSFTVGCCAPLLVLGEAPLLLMVGQPGGLDALLGQGRGAVGMNLDALYALCWILAAAALAVGYGVRRDWAGTLDRLGLRRVSRRQVGFALGLTALIVAAMSGVDFAITHVWLWMDWPTTDADAFKALMAPLITPTGAVVIGITAGVGEEVAVRGILQPRLGILLSNALFTSLHAYQYNWDALISVFLIGLILGVIRKRTNTTVSAIVHGSYDFVLVLFEFISRPA